MHDAPVVTPCRTEQAARNHGQLFPALPALAPQRVIFFLLPGSARVAAVMSASSRFFPCLSGNGTRQALHDGAFLIPCARACSRAVASFRHT